MSFTEAIRICLAKYATFSGRARRSEYWWFVLFVFGGGMILDLVEALLLGTTDLLSSVFSLATFLPLLSAGWRRMQDSSRPGWYILLPLAVIAVSVLAVFAGLFLIERFEETGADPDLLSRIAEPLGLGGMIAFLLVQLGTAILMIWWLTRPSDPAPNEWGPPPA